MNWKLTYRAYHLKSILLFTSLVVMQIVYSTGIKQLQDISISKNKNSITISWSAPAQQPDVYYEIEKAGQDKIFKTAGILFPGKDDVNRTGFSFKDNLKHIGSGKIIYYRVKQVNTDGTASYSLIKAIDLNSNKVINIGETVLLYNNVHRYSYPSEKCRSDNNTKYMMAGILRLGYNHFTCSYNKTYRSI
ncbi:MAG: hypothetical protein HYR66_15700 [Sphingobacteriales bacterium]|nr:hypothetical protein [Sphingobacteriales bacterium]MBI3720195.1 hypothetical protein [Sphingobacteriales bacterium]